MKVFLFNPPTPDGRIFTREGRCTQEAGVWATQWPPVSLATAAALLEADGHDVFCIDFPAVAMGIEDLKAFIAEHRPHLAFWSTGSPTLLHDLHISNIIKDISDSTLTGVMGTHVTVMAEATLKASSVDVVIRGEPEGIIRNICKNNLEHLYDIPGISFRERGGKIINNLDADWLLPEDIPAPSWHLIDLTPYRLPLSGRPFLIVAPVRGCPFRCSFCTAPIYYGRKIRKRPVQNIIKEMENNIKRHGIREFFIWADTFTADRDYTQQFCRGIIDAGLRITWTCNSRVDTVDSETLELMKKAGLWMISFGLESGNDTILEGINKKINLTASRKAVRMAHDMGIKVAGHFILGFPGETRQTMEETLRFALEIPLDIAQFYAAAPFPGTSLYDEALRQGWLKNRGSDLFPLSISQNDAALELPGLPATEVDSFRRRAYRKFYGRPKILRGLLAMVEPSAAAQALAGMKRFLNWAR
ncbi:MAG: radical SAM protein [Deltaproteobacteria bacterium]|nr:radical SAM protein [Deltaproteobacteria bacterium]